MSNICVFLLLVFMSVCDVCRIIGPSVVVAVVVVVDCLLFREVRKEG